MQPAEMPVTPLGQWVGRVDARNGIASGRRLEVRIMKPPIPPQPSAKEISKPEVTQLGSEAAPNISLMAQWEVPYSDDWPEVYEAQVAKAQLCDAVIVVLDNRNRDLGFIWSYKKGADLFTIPDPDDFPLIIRAQSPPRPGPRSAVGSVDSQSCSSRSSSKEQGHSDSNSLQEVDFSGGELSEAKLRALEKSFFEEEFGGMRPSNTTTTESPTQKVSWEVKRQRSVSRSTGVQSSSRTTTIEDTCSSCSRTEEVSDARGELSDAKYGALKAEGAQSPLGEVFGGRRPSSATTRPCEVGRPRSVSGSTNVQGCSRSRTSDVSELTASQRPALMAQGGQRSFEEAFGGRRSSCATTTEFKPVREFSEVRRASTVLKRTGSGLLQGRH